MSSPTSLASHPSIAINALAEFPRCDALKKLECAMYLTLSEEFFYSFFFFAQKCARQHMYLCCRSTLAFGKIDSRSRHALRSSWSEQRLSYLLKCIWEAVVTVSPSFFLLSYFIADDRYSSHFHDRSIAVQSILAIIQLSDKSNRQGCID